MCDFESSIDNTEDEVGRLSWLSRRDSPSRGLPREDSVDEAIFATYDVDSQLFQSTNYKNTVSTSI